LTRERRRKLRFIRQAPEPRENREKAGVTRTKAAIALALALASFGPATAADEPGPHGERSLVVYGDDPCPPSQGDDIVVCARRPEEERYRIPAPLRREGRRTEQSWGTRAAELDEAQRDGRPNSCSVVGSFGQTGCTADMLRQWANERRARRRR
jgi:hypothetical protein